MALSTVTFAKLLLAARQGCGDKLDTNYKTYPDLVNQALSDFSSLRDWQWLRRQGTLSTVAAQNYIALPADFGKFIGDPHLVGTIGHIAIPKTLDEIQAFRASSTITVAAFTYFYCVSSVAQSGVTAQPTWRVELWPTPIATTADAFTYSYQRIMATLSAATDTPDIPAVWDSMLELFVRMKAAEYVNDDRAPKLSQQFERDFGRMVGGGMDSQQANLGRLGSGRGSDIIYIEPTVTGA